MRGEHHNLESCEFHVKCPRDVIHTEVGIKAALNSRAAIPRLPAFEGKEALIVTFPNVAKQPKVEIAAHKFAPFKYFKEAIRQTRGSYRRIC